MDIDLLIKLIEDLRFDMPDSSPWSYDKGWNDAIEKIVELIKSQKTDDQ